MVGHQILRTLLNNESPQKKQKKTKQNKNKTKIKQKKKKTTTTNRRIAPPAPPRDGWQGRRKESTTCHRLQPPLRCCRKAPDRRHLRVMSRIEWFTEVSSRRLLGPAGGASMAPSPETWSNTPHTGDGHRRHRLGRHRVIVRPTRLVATVAAVDATRRARDIRRAHVIILQRHAATHVRTLTPKTGKKGGGGREEEGRDGVYSQFATNQPWLATLLARPTQTIQLAHQQSTYLGLGKIFRQGIEIDLRHRQQQPACTTPQLYRYS